MNNFVKCITLLLIGICVPLVTYAQSPVWLNSLIVGLGGILPRILGVLVSLALVLFFWGLIKFISHSGDEKAVAEGKLIMFWGVIAIFVIVSSWGIVTLIQTITGTTGPTTQTAPQVTYP